VVELHAAGVGPELTAWLGTALVVLGVAGYQVLAATSRLPWPRRRTLLWLIGSLVVLAGISGGLADAAEDDYVAHMISHVLVGMLGPLLLVLAAPVTLLLRSLPVPAARRLSRVLGSRPVRLLTEPMVAAVLSVGGLWMLYATDLFAAAHHTPVLHLAWHAHLFVAGYLFAVSMISVDPLPHRRSYLHRSLVLVVALAAHDILAKHLYAQPPPGVGGAAESGAMIMYYGGEVVDIVIMVILCARWYRSAGRGIEALRTEGART
jgi:putative membrane protein